MNRNRLILSKKLRIFGQGALFLSGWSVAACDAPHKTLNSTKSSAVAVNVEDFRPDSKQFQRIDHMLENNESMRTDHALHETLAGDRMIEAYEVYRRVGRDEILCLVKFGKSVNGYPGVVHGGESSGACRCFSSCR